MSKFFIIPIFFVPAALEATVDYPHVFVSPLVFIELETSVHKGPLSCVRKQWDFQNRWGGRHKLS